MGLEEAGGGGPGQVKAEQSSIVELVSGVRLTTGGFLRVVPMSFLRHC